MAIFEQFLINAGENQREIEGLFHEKRVEMFQEAGKTDIDGCPRPSNWRTAKTVDLKYVGQLLCACTHLGFEQGNKVIDSLFHYTHDECIIMPGLEENGTCSASEQAISVFKDFLYHCGEDYGYVNDIAKRQLGE